MIWESRCQVPQYFVVGSTRGVTTDLDGTFEIEVKSSDKLKISFSRLRRSDYYSR